MSALQRYLVNIDIVRDDIATMPPSERLSELHVRYVGEYQQALSALTTSLDTVTEKQFRMLAEQAGLSALLCNKQMVAVHLKMTAYVLSFWQADSKAQAILDAQFDSGSDKRLELLQVKAVKAKSQLKTAARAMGEEDYAQFSSALGLTGTALDWAHIIGNVSLNS